MLIMLIWTSGNTPHFIFANDHNGPVIYKYMYSKNSHLWTLDQ